VKNTGNILGWKFNHVSGIATKEEGITEWPESLGPRPTESQLLTWETEYNTWLATPTVSDSRKTRMRELLGVSESSWTTAQLQELLALVAKEACDWTDE